MHIKKNEAGDNFSFISWCGVKVGGLTRSYLSVDNALKAVERKMGVHPCHKCLQEIRVVVKSGLPEPSPPNNANQGDVLTQDHTN